MICLFSNFLEQTESVMDPMYDPSVEELNIEEMLMQEASSGTGLGALDPSVKDPIGRVQEEASSFVNKARDEVSKRAGEFEPLINIAKGEEKELTQEQLQVIDKKVSELQGVSHGQHIFEEEPEQSGADGNIISQATLAKTSDPIKETSELTDSSSQGLSIENMIMEEATSGQHSQVLSDSQKYLYEQVQGAADAVKKGIDETRDEVSQRVSQFEPLLDITKSEEQEITQEHLEAINEKLSEIHDVSFGHDLKIFREIDNPKPVEEVIEDIITQQAPAKEVTARQETEEKDSVSVLEKNSAAQTKSNAQPEASMDAAAKLEDSILQVAKPVTLDDSYTSAATEASQAQVETVPEGASSSHSPQSSGFITPGGTGGAPVAELSSVAETAAGAAFTAAAAAAPVVAAAAAAAPVAAAVATAPAPAAAAAAAATVAPEPSFSHDEPVTQPQPTTASAKPKPKLLGKKPLAKEKPKSTVCIVLF